MFGICHWWAISPIHPWARTIFRIQRELGVFKHRPHITICTNSTLDAAIPQPPEKFFCITNVTQTSTESIEGSLWALEIPITGIERPDKQPLHLTLAYRWNDPFSPQEINKTSRMCASMFGFQCTLFEHQIWECNREPETWKWINTHLSPKVMLEVAD